MKCLIVIFWQKGKKDKKNTVHLLQVIFATSLLRVRYSLYLTFTTPWANSKDDSILKYFSCISQKIGFDISCTLSPKVSSEILPGMLSITYYPLFC